MKTRLPKPKPERQDFTVAVSASGYMLHYKGKPIGGVGINGKYRGRGAASQAREYRKSALAAIDELLNGCGQQRFIAQIDKINQNYQEC